MSPNRPLGQLDPVRIDDPGVVVVRMGLLPIGMEGIAAGQHENMDTLVALGTAEHFSTRSLQRSGLRSLPARAFALHERHGQADVYYEAAATIIVLVMFGKMLEARATGRTSAAISRLLGMQATVAQEVFGTVRSERFRSLTLLPATLWLFGRGKGSPLMALWMRASRRSMSRC